MFVDVIYRNESKMKVAKRKCKTIAAPKKPTITVADINELWGERHGTVIIQGPMGQPIAKADSYYLNISQVFDSISRHTMMNSREILESEVVFFRFENGNLHIYLKDMERK